MSLHAMIDCKALAFDSLIPRLRLLQVLWQGLSYSEGAR